MYKNVFMLLLHSIINLAAYRILHWKPFSLLCCFLILALLIRKSSTTLIMTLGICPGQKALDPKIHLFLWEFWYFTLISSVWSFFYHRAGHLVCLLMVATLFQRIIIWYFSEEPAPEFLHTLFEVLMCLGYWSPGWIIQVFFFVLFSISVFLFYFLEDFHYFIFPMFSFLLLLYFLHQDSLPPPQICPYLWLKHYKDV